ncbi:MAG: alanine racemase [Fibrobacter sp.]|nr:alanine racemase [Fibrobacter sp.]
MTFNKISTRVEISLDNLLHNLNQIRSLSPGAGVLAVIKDCAYGCGSVMIARTLEQQGGVNFFAVARPEEAFKLRESGLKSPILVLGEASTEQIKAAFTREILFSCNSLETLYDWIASGLQVRFHCHIDTGMNRMGILPSETEMLAKIFLDNAGDKLFLEGIYTHLACADEPGTTTVDDQLTKFRQSISILRSHGLSPNHVHFANSATAMRFELGECTHMRPGIALYGCKPDPAQDFTLDLRPVASLKSFVTKIKKVPAGSPVSYGWNYVTSSETWIATIAAGYAQGVPRFLSNKGSVLIRGKKYRIAGNVTMDYIMVDAGPEPEISVGDEVVIMGSQSDKCITPDEVAAIGNTISYEVLCHLSTAIDRLYLLNDSIVLHSAGNIF